MRQTNKRSDRHLAGRTMLAASMIIALMLTFSTAMAGNCKLTNRKPGDPSLASFSADTTVKNNTSDQTFFVEILRNGKVKRSKSIGPGEETSHLATVSFDGAARGIQWELAVNIYVSEGDANFAYCAYKVGRGNDWKWDLAQDPICANVDVLTCANGACNITCDKSFNDMKVKYKTYFHLEN